MTLDAEDRDRFLNYRPNWAWYRAKPTGEEYTFQLKKYKAKQQLPDEYTLTRLAGTKNLRLILIVAFLLFVIGPGLYLSNNTYTKSDFDGFVLIGGLASMAVIWASHRVSQNNQPKPLLKLSRNSLVLFTKGEFTWKNIVGIRLLYDGDGGGFLLLLLNNGTIIEERLPSINEDFLLNGYTSNIKALQQAIEQYWSVANNEVE